MAVELPAASPVLLLNDYLRFLLFLAELISWAEAIVGGFLFVLFY